MTNKLQTKESWFPLLNWPDLPNFGLVHTIADFYKMKNNYVVTPELGQLIENLLIGLRGETQLHNLLIMGKPGCGKTSFVYFLKRLLENEPRLIKGGAKFYIYICHLEGVKENNTISEPLLLEEIVNSLTDYFHANNLERIASEINDQPITDKQKIRKLIRYIKNNKPSFEKVLIFILDDVDTGTNDEVLQASLFLHTNLELASIKLWLNIQDITFYSKYSKETRTFLKTFYPDRKPFIKIQLFDIINHRIQQLGESALNPYSENLCNTVQELHFGHLRESLSFLETIIEDILPKGFSTSTDIEVIRKYIEKSAYNSFLKHNILPNIHDPIHRALKPLPIIFELLNIIKHYDEIGDFLFSILNDVIQRKTNSITELKDAEIRIRISDFEKAITWLFDNEIIERIKDNRVILTSKGAALQLVMNSKYYYDLCKNAIKDKMVPSIYWKFIDINVDYQNIVINKYDWAREFIESSS